MELEVWRGWNPSTSFIERLDRDLKREFEFLTQKHFDSERFHFMVDPVGGLEYYPDSEFPYGQINGTLMLRKGSIDIGFKWFDKSTKRLYKLEDNIIDSNLEFHWIELPLNNPFIEAIQDTVFYNISDLCNLKSVFPILSSSKVFSTDVTLLFQLINNSDVDKLASLLKNIQYNWNNSKAMSNYILSNKGLVHSIRFLGLDIHGQALFSLDMGTASDKVICYIIENIISSDIPVAHLIFQSE
jgi:hypothetical protein